MLHRYRFPIVGLAAFIAFWCSSFSYVFAAATLSLSPALGTYTIGSTFTVKAMVDGAGASMNAVESVLAFDPKLLSVQSATKDGSIFSLWTTEPEFSNTQGTVTFGGGNPKPFTSKSTLVSVTFKVLKAGTATVSFSEGSVLAADGKGTDILGEKASGVYELGGTAPVKPAEPAPDPEPADGGIVPDAPLIKSTTHPEEAAWYKASRGEFVWENLPDVTSVRLSLSSKPTTKPSVLYTPPISSKTLEDLEEGVWYLAVQAKNGSGWGPAGVRKIQVDQTPPLPFTVSVGANATSSTPTLVIGTTTDALSGISHVEVVVGTESAVLVKLTEIVEGNYVLLPHGKGSYTVKVRTFDNAGNSVEASTNILIEEDMAAKKNVTEVIEISFWQKYGMIIIISLLLIIILFLLILNFYQKNKLVREMRRGAKEAEEIATKMDKIFSALKDEVEEQINALDKKPRLSDSEKRAINKIKEAIDISQELINKEIEDVEKILE